MSSPCIPALTSLNTFSSFTSLFFSTSPHTSQLACHPCTMTLSIPGPGDHAIGVRKWHPNTDQIDPYSSLQSAPAWKEAA
eukprot:929870-Pelagomonas_calceolata.AAC.1